MNCKQQSSSRRGSWLLLAGAAVGIATAASGILRFPAAEPPPVVQPAPVAAPEPLPSGAVARVNDRLISRQDFESVLALEVTAGAEPNRATGRRVLDRMIDEELRVQRALELKLHLTDSRVRMDLASAVAEAATAAAEEAPDEASLRASYEQKRDYYTRRGPLRVRQIWVTIEGGNIGDAFARAREAAKMLREKVPFETVKGMMGSSEPRPVPDKLLAPDELAGFIDREVLNVALNLQPGDISDPVRTVAGFHVLEVQERRPHENASFETCLADVEADYWATRMRQALEANAAELRKAATIEQIDP